MLLRALLPALVCFGMLLPGDSLWAADPAGKPYTYKEIDGRKLSLYVTSPAQWQADDTRPAIVFFHGGGWVGGTPGQFTEHSKYLASRGMVAVQVEYRLLDRKQSLPPDTCVADARSAMRWVRGHAQELGIDPQRIASAGGSAGGHLAAFVGMVDSDEAATTDTSVSSKSNAMMLFNPVFDNGPDGWGYQRVGKRYKEFSPIHNISPDDPPAIVFLGSADKLIPVSTAEKFQQQMKQADVACEVMIFPDMPHGFFNHGRYDNKPYTKTVVAMDRFLSSLGWLKGEPTITEE